MKKIFLLSFLFHYGSAFGDCQAPSQGFLETKLKESFETKKGENELKEWVLHSKNGQLREEIKSLYRRSKYVKRLDREDLMGEAKIKFEKMIANTGRSREIDQFPSQGAHSKMKGVDGALTIEMCHVSKKDLDVLPPEILDKLESKVKIHYSYPYDKFDYFLTYNDKELPMDKAFLKIQSDLEEACEFRMIQNREHRKFQDQMESSSAQ